MALEIQTGKTVKPQPGTLTINFPNPFAQVPVVVVTPFWENGNAEVDNILTLSSVTRESFTVASEIYGTTTFVSWIAIA